jgi:hypothetical protein
MIKRVLLALGLMAALAACGTPAASSGPTLGTEPTAPTLESPSAPSLESPSDSGLETEEPSESPSAS